jgi:hypothetical protein
MHRRVALTTWLMIIGGGGKASVVKYDTIRLMIIDGAQNAWAGGIDALVDDN